jgi:hypothetical protein
MSQENPTKAERIEAAKEAARKQSERLEKSRQQGRNGDKR